MGLIALLFSIISGICFFVMSYTHAYFMGFGILLCISFVISVPFSFVGICKKSYFKEAIAALLISITSAAAFVLYAYLRFHNLADFPLLSL